MPSQRRVKVLLAGVLTVVLLILYYSGEAAKVQNQKFYKSTVEAMEARAAAEKSASDRSKLFKKLGPHGKTADEAALGLNIEKPAVPLNTEKKAEEKDEELVEVSVAGRTKMTVPKPKASSAPRKEEDTEKVEDHAEAKAELNGILKRSPIIIFSKSYCPYSAKAKNILLEKYSIVPTPFVVELDQHPLGKDLQAVLAANTGRRTVPNVLVNGKSIGGGDDVAALHQKDELATTLKSMGGKWIMEVNHKEQDE